AIVQISHPRQPCWKLEQRWGVKDFMAQVNKTGRTGWYLRVLQEGYVEAGNALVLVERPFPQWTIARANEVMRNRKTDPLSAWTLARCSALAPTWQKNLRITSWLPKTIWQQCVRFGKKASHSLQKALPNNKGL
ncbi:MAG: MOSC domain-containing protein, partial [Planctomycetota bacterium]